MKKHLLAGSLTCLLGLLSTTTFAGSFVVDGNTSGVTFSSPSNSVPTFGPGTVSGTCGGGNGSLSIGGSATTNYKWVPSQVGGHDAAGDIAPKQVIVIETCSVSTDAKSYYGTGYASPSGSSNNGLGATWTNTPTPQPTTIVTGGGGFWIPIGTDLASSSVGSKASIVNVTAAANGNPAKFTVQSSPSASASASNGPITATISYSVQVYPVVIAVAGTIQDADLNYQILPGQLVTGSITVGGSNISVDPTTYQWSVSGSTFKTFVVASDDSSGTVNKMEASDWKTSSPAWRWVGSDNDTVTGNVTVVYAPPGFSSASVGTATGTLNVNVAFVGYEVKITAIRDGHMDGDMLYSNPATQAHDADFLYDATTPAAFISGGDTGKCQLTQFLMNTNYYYNGQLGMTSVSATDSMDTLCLDGAYLYPFCDGRINADTTYGYGNDAPFWGATVDQPSFLSFSTNFTANMYCMYGAPGMTSNDVPLGYQAWTWNAAMSRVSGGSWNMTSNHSAISGTQTDVTAHQQWKHMGLRRIGP